MLCENCNENEATVHFKQVMNGVSEEMHLCAECAKSRGINVVPPLGLTDFLLGVGAAPAPAPGPHDNRSCPGCHMRLGDFRKTSRLGCPTCYEAFGDELKPLLESMHRDTRHVGKVPASARAEAKIAGLRKSLGDAVAEQRFEDAAHIRDQIKELRGPQAAGDAGEGETALDGATRSEA